MGELFRQQLRFMYQEITFCPSLRKNISYDAAPNRYLSRIKLKQPLAHKSQPRCKCRSSREIENVYWAVQIAERYEDFYSLDMIYITLAISRNISILIPLK